MSYADNGFPAMVSDFTLDTYEITVGRFRKFVAAYSQNMIAEGAGENRHNAADTGWSTSWNASLETNSTTLAAAVQCNSNFQTWTSGNDNLPMNCLDWFEAAAFCIWDGGRLPTEAEWNYAAAGGIEQREYPWGSAAPGCTLANYYGQVPSGWCVVTPSTGGAANPVGSEPSGNGKWGQADMAGNVSEWVQDSSVDSYTNPCSNCANLVDTTTKVARGGSFFDSQGWILASHRGGVTWYNHDYKYGARCVSH